MSMASITEIQPEQVIKLYDFDADQYADYMYRIINGMHHFIPLDEDLFTHYRFSDIRHALRHDAMTVQGIFFSEYIETPNCYRYNNIIFSDISIVPIERIVSFNLNNMGHFEGERMASIERAVFLPPIDVRPYGDNYEIVNGNHRYMFSLNRGYSHIPVRIQRS